MSFNRFYLISPLALIAVSACRSPYNAGGNAVNGAIVKGLVYLTMMKVTPRLLKSFL